MTKWLHLHVVASQWDAHVDMSLSLPGEVDYATLPPLVTGFHDRPAGRCIVSKRIGGTAATFTEGLAPRPSAAGVNPAAFTQAPPTITNGFR